VIIRIYYRYLSVINLGIYGVNAVVYLSFTPVLWCFRVQSICASLSIGVGCIASFLFSLCLIDRYNKWETFYFCSYCLCFLFPCSSLSLLCLFLLPGSVSTYLEVFLLILRKRFGLVLAFLIMSMKISWFSWELLLLYCLFVTASWMPWATVKPNTRESFCRCCCVLSLG